MENDGASPEGLSSVDPEKDQSCTDDVVLVIKGHDFKCSREVLARHSKYFETMFGLELTKKMERIQVKGPVDKDNFQLFLDVIDGKNIMTDAQVGKALELARFLKSQKQCLEHLAGSSKITLKEQFQLAEKHDCENLTMQVISSVNNKFQLHAVVPQDFNSLRDRTMNVVLLKSFELLGIRRPLTPPLPQGSDFVTEGLSDGFVDDAE